MFKILDALYILSVQKNFGFKFTTEQLEEARFNEGHVSVQLSRKTYHFKIPIIHLNDLLVCHHTDLSEELKPWS